ncbi:methylaspartate mutase subunit S [Chloroflexota bacterium]
MGNKTILAGVLQDIHHLGIVIIKGALEQAGFKVVNLGGRVSQEEFIQAAVETDASAILLSTSTGHAEIECEGMREKCQEAGLDSILLYLGGNLVIDPRREQKWEDIEIRFKKMGYDRVYPPDCDIEIVVEDLKADLGILV